MEIETREDATQNSNGVSLLPLPEGFCYPLKTQCARWKHFYRSIDKKAGNRYDAKCGFCLSDIDGRPEQLQSHVLRCTSWPALEKTLYLEDASKESVRIKRKRPREVLISSSSSTQQTMFNIVSKPMSSQKTNEIHGLLLKGIIYGGISSTVGDNMFFNQFVQALSPSYKVPSHKILSERVLTDIFSKHLQKKLAHLPYLTDFTICADGWADVSGNSICVFMVLKEEKEVVVDIVDLSTVRHTTVELKEQLLSRLLMNNVAVDNALACVMDSQSTMGNSRNDLQLAHPNVRSFQCCLHAFNLLVKDVLGFSEVVKVCKDNQNLVHYFTSSHIWRKALKTWQAEKKIPHFLSTFCETRWYSLSRVCLGVAAYEEGFRYCLELSKRPEYPKITNLEVLNTIVDHHHFAYNECLVEALKPIVDVIGKLEKRTTTLADVLGSFIIVYHNARMAHYPIQGLQTHILCAIGKRVKEFEDPIYFVALFLHPAYKSMAMSRKMTGDRIIRASLEIAKDWNFSKRGVGLLFKELINYKNGDAPFDDLKETSNRSARDVWKMFSSASPLLRRFATKVFAIIPHSGACERFFSTLGLIKTKPRNRFDVEKLNMLAQIKFDLAGEVCTKNKACEASDSMVDGLSMGFFDMSNEDDVRDDLLDEDVEVVQFENEYTDARIMEDLFDFDAFERDIAYVSLETNVDTNVGTSEGDGEWSIDDVINEYH